MNSKHFLNKRIFLIRIHAAVGEARLQKPLHKTPLFNILLLTINLTNIAK